MINYIFEEATQAELEQIIKLLYDDEQARKRESLNNLAAYTEAFERIYQNPDAKLIIAKDEQELIALAQINFIDNLTYQGGRRAQIEGVRVAKAYRGQGIGSALFKYLIDLAKAENCCLVQLATNKDREDAYRFYQRLGFQATHVGFKLFFNTTDTNN